MRVAQRLLHVCVTATVTGRATRETRRLHVPCGDQRRFHASGSGECVWREDETVVLGVETSCDDTGVAVMKGSGELLGDALHSQTDVHKT